MEKLIPLINEIREILQKAELANIINLPQIVVVGAQSTGKSSVLEAIVGRECLPRGSGICTRRPILLQLQNIPKGQQEWAEFAHQPGNKIQQFSQIVKEIEMETTKTAGSNKGISDIPIYLRIYSPSVVDLTLIDLPGITKIPVGDQPSDIENKIRNLIMSFISNPNSIILALTAANTDLANSDSLKLAREVDPDGIRTIGVVTKIDLMEQDTNALETLQGKIYPLKLGYVGVVCRSQKDVNQQKAIEDSLNDEKKFFESHKEYRKYSDKLGIPYLVKLLNLTLINHIKSSLPQIREDIGNLIQTKEYELSQYGDVIDLSESSSKSSGLLVLNLINKFCKAFCDLTKGRYVKGNMSELCGGARINYIFNDIFRKTINEINPFEVLSDEDIRTAIRNSNGLKPTLFVPEGAFEILIKQQISRLQEPSLECSHLVFEELRKILLSINIPEITRFDNLANSIQQVMESVLSRCLTPTDTMIKNLIQIELGYINTSHPDFIGGTALLLGILQNQTESQKNESEDEKIIPGKNNFNPNINRKIEKEEKKEEIIDNKKNKNTQSVGTSFWNKIGFGKKQEADELDAKLSLANQNNNRNKNNNKKEDNLFGNELYFPGQNDFYYTARNDSNQYQRTLLPSIPNHIYVTENPTKREQLETEMIKKLIISYYNVVKKNVNDSVPKTIISFLVNQSMDICQREMVSSLYKTEKIEELLTENAFIGEARRDCLNQYKLLKACMSTLTEFEAKY